MAEPNNLIPENEERIALLEEQIATLLRQRQVTNEFSITAAAKLFEKGFSGEPSTLTEFIDNVEAAESLVHVDQKPILVKYILAKITGNAKRTLNIRPSTITCWAEIKEKLETHFSVQRTFAYYTTQLCQVKQKPNESITQWGARVEQLIQATIDSTARFTTEWSNAEKQGGQNIIIKLGRNVFINGILHDAVREAVKMVSEKMSLKEVIDRAVIEDCDRRSNVKIQDKGMNAVQKRFPQNVQGNRIKRENVHMVDTKGCYKCNKIGHFARECSTPVCDYCKRIGHNTRDCRSNRGGLRGNRGSSRGSNSSQGN